MYCANEQFDDDRNCDLVVGRVGVDYKSPITITITITVPIKLSITITITITVVIEKAITITITITIIRLRLQSSDYDYSYLSTMETILGFLYGMLFVHLQYYHA